MSASEPEALLEVTDLDVFYGDFQALFGVSMSVAQGGATALVGANGAGKTTLLRAIAGARAPASGVVRYRARMSRRPRRTSGSPAASPWCRRAASSSEA